MAELRMTIATQRVLRAMLEDANAERYGIEIADLAELATGTVHPILARLEGVGWLTSRWEEVDPRTEGRAARRYYRLTGSGVEQARDSLARAYRPPPAARSRRARGRKSHDRPRPRRLDPRTGVDHVGADRSVAGKQGAARRPDPGAMAR